MGHDTASSLPYSVVEKMVQYATPHNSDFAFNYNAGSALSHLFRHSFPDSPLVEANRWYEELKPMFHAFDRVFFYAPQISVEHLMGLTLMGADNAALVLCYPVARSWFGRKGPMKDDAHRMLNEKRVASLNSVVIDIIETDQGAFAVARCSNYARSSSNEKRPGDLIRAVSFIQHATADTNFFWWLNEKRTERPGIDEVLHAIRPVHYKPLPEIVSYLRLKQIGKSKDVTAAIAGGLDEVTMVEKERRQWLVERSRHPFDPPLDLG